MGCWAIGLTGDWADGRTGDWADRRLGRQATVRTSDWADKRLGGQATGRTGNWADNSASAYQPVSLTARQPNSPSAYQPISLSAQQPNLNSCCKLVGAGSAATAAIDAAQTRHGLNGVSTLAEHGHAVCIARATARKFYIMQFAISVYLKIDTLGAHSARSKIDTLLAVGCLLYHNNAE